MLVRLMYASRAVPAVDQEELLAILKQSKANNTRSGMTGALCLCSTERIFIQVLEGGREAVNALYRRILADTRHTDPVLLHYAEILNPALLLKYSESARLDPYAVSGKATVALFEELVATAAIMGQ
jgi:hypothetical protein